MPEIRVARERSARLGSTPSAAPAASLPRDGGSALERAVRELGNELLASRAASDTCGRRSTDGNALFQASTCALLRYAGALAICRFELGQAAMHDASSLRRVWHSVTQADAQASSGSAGALQQRLAPLFTRDTALLEPNFEPSDALLSRWSTELGEIGCALGDAYEPLLEKAASLDADGIILTVRETTDKAHVRRRSGSYYTPSRLTSVLLDSALEPVIQEVLEAHAAQCAEQRALALLRLRIVDPACGSGHFLLAAARRLAEHVAAQGDPNPGPAALQQALARVLTDCIFGIDLNPVAVELCRMTLAQLIPQADFEPLRQHVVVANALLFGHPSAEGRARLSASPQALPDWRRNFASVALGGGFDVILGNPPWIAHAGRAAQPLEPAIKAFFQHNYEAFADYPTTHGMFVSACAHNLRLGGRLGLIIPSSVSELEGYAPARRAHDRLCDFPGELVDFGEGQFAGVTQPCMALISRRCANGRASQQLGKPWPMQRPDLDPTSRALLERLSRLTPLAEDLFGERGLQSDASLRRHFVEAGLPNGRFATALREGSDIREFRLLAPRVFVDRLAVGARLRSDEEFRNVAVLIRQTARYPIAAISDGGAFRNSLLAGFSSPAWPREALVGLLNSALIRWLHHARFRDARQPIMPQVKIAHLRSIPEPPAWTDDKRDALAHLGLQLAACDAPAERDALDAFVFELYGLSTEEDERVRAWHQQIALSASARRRTTKA
ncbi:MAG TPA: N-6 DNA methylase [Polyangiaceae bacterium]|nr:N-6 DNA methylase [Polyangiaceae bacterium]